MATVAGEAGNVPETLDYLLGTDESEMPDMRQVAERFSDLAGVKGAEAKKTGAGSNPEAVSCV